MKRLFILPVLFLTLLVGNPAFSADFQKGLDALKKGDYATVLREWTPLAEQGHAHAQAVLGVMYGEGKGVPQDYETAVKWHTLAAEQGLALAQYNLGFMYEKGQVVPQDSKTAFKWFKLAAEQGHALAQLHLGWSYARGRGTLEDIPHAHLWWVIAASQGNEDAREARDVIEKHMNATAILKGRNLAKEWMAKYQK